jgi:MFS family permease
LLAHPHVWVLFAMSVVLAALNGLQRPSLEALTPRLVERDELMAAGALSTFRMTLGQIAGPALAGILLATAGLPATYAVDRRRALHRRRRRGRAHAARLLALRRP